MLILAEGKDIDQEAIESLAPMDAQDPSMSVDSAEEHINRGNAESLGFATYLLNPSESSAGLQSDNRDLDKSAYWDLMDLVKTQYIEDLNYSSDILNKFVNEKIDANEAMTTTMTLFVLTSSTVDMVDQINPPGEFIGYHNTAKLALINLEGYLWNMVKFYETNRREYALQARYNFNESMKFNRELENSSSILRHK
jgi:hypothetical protein